MKKTERRGESERLAVVLPARNEQTRLGECLASLGPFAAAGSPIVVVDASSDDETMAIAVRYGARVLASPLPERGHAMAHGYAAVAGSADLVLFAHADMVFPPSARERILDAMAVRPDAVGGALGHRIDDRRWRFRWIEAGNRFRARRLGLPYGDQAQFYRTSAIEQAGGFPEMPEMEDLELDLRTRSLGPLLYLECPVRIPNRHWTAGVLRATLRNWRRSVGYRLRRTSPP